MKEVEWDDIRDELIVEFCNKRCPQSYEDSECPNHNCPVYRTITFSTNEMLNDQIAVFHQTINGKYRIQIERSAVKGR